MQRPGRAVYPKGWAEVSVRSFLSDFTNEMGQSFQTKRVGSQGHPAPGFLQSPSVAIVPWFFDHFISEIADGKQRTETSAHPFG